jgi:hypothetical protein
VNRPASGPVVRLAEAPLSAGVETHLEHGVPLQVFPAAKTVADCFEFRGKGGTGVAVTALRDGWRQQRFTLDELWHSRASAAWPQ